MNLANWVWCTMLTPAGMAITTGSGGIDASGSASPAAHYLPGLLKNKIRDRA